MNFPMTIKSYRIPLYNNSIQIQGSVCCFLFLFLPVIFLAAFKQRSQGASESARTCIHPRVHLYMHCVCVGGCAHARVRVLLLLLCVAAKRTCI